MRRFLAVLACAAVACSVLVASSSEAVAAKRCGTITVKYSYGSYKFKVSVARGKVKCSTARSVMKRGIPAMNPNPSGWRCTRSAPGASYSNICTSTRGSKRVLHGTSLG